MAKPSRTKYMQVIGELNTLIVLLQREVDGGSVFASDRSRLEFVTDIVRRAQELLRVSAPKTYNSEGL